MTTKQICEKLLSLANKATQGRYEKDGDYICTPDVALFEVVDQEDSRDANQEYIAALDPDTVRLICERLIKLEEALDTEELELELSANEGQRGSFNDGASAVLREWIKTNRRALREGI